MPHQAPDDGHIPSGQVASTEGPHRVESKISSRTAGQQDSRTAGQQDSRTAGQQDSRTVIVAVRSAGALHRLLDVLPVFDGDTRVTIRFTLLPGSHFDVGALAALDHSGARILPWEEARRIRHDLVLSASPKGELHELSGRRALLPHGAGFNKTISNDGSPDVPSGLDPHYLLVDGVPWADLHALAHEDQAARLAQHCPSAVDRVAVVGDPTLDRLLASVPHRQDYRGHLATGARQLIVLTSTWGPESLLARRPGLSADLIGVLPHDAFQVALIVHPNEYSHTGSFDLSRQLAPALAAGLVLTRPYEEWASLLVAADAVVTDHGSTALYAAALGRPVIGAYDGGRELLPGSPMAQLLDSVPRLSEASGLEHALRDSRTVDTRGHAAGAFAQQGRALPLLRQRLYRMLGLRPPSGPLEAPAFSRPSTTPRQPSAFAVRAEVSGHRIALKRFPPHVQGAVHHLAAEYPTAGPRQIQSAAVLWRRARTAVSSAQHTAWTAEGWTSHVLEEAPGCRTSAAVLSPRRCLLRHRTAGLFSVRLEPHRDGGMVSHADPTAVVSAVHAWLGANANRSLPVSLLCDTGPVAVRVRLCPATADDLGYEL
ncbi:translation initiation factor 2 [Streptomyces sp. NPDC050423]|uniref:translation initiation factor 2 n=1 Tax=Streptomyces sp. NPDC050423 TaxID=3155402 RepID=UPI00342DBB80